jgi:hypothetical protein
MLEEYYSADKEHSFDSRSFYENSSRSYPFSEMFSSPFSSPLIIDRFLFPQEDPAYRYVFVKQEAYLRPCQVLQQAVFATLSSYLKSAAAIPL